MGREPQNFSVWGTIEHSGPRFRVCVRATALDHPTPEASFVERSECATWEEAKARQLQMVREISARLVAQGNIVVDVNLDA